MAKQLRNYWLSSATNGDDNDAVVDDDDYYGDDDEFDSADNADDDDDGVDDNTAQQWFCSMNIFEVLRVSYAFVASDHEKHHENFLSRNVFEKFSNFQIHFYICQLLYTAQIFLTFFCFWEKFSCFL